MKGMAMGSTPRPVIIAMCILSVWTCTRRPANGISVSGGYFTPGPYAAQAFGMPPAERIDEWPSEDIPTAVVAAAIQAAERAAARPECNRYFPTDRMYLVVLAYFCGSYFGKSTDSRPVVALSPAGDVIGEISWVAGQGPAELQPYDRFDVDELAPR